MTRGRLVARHASTALLVLTLGVLVLTLVAGRSSYRLVTVWSGSMAPTVPTGSLLLEELRPTADLRAGDVITFRAPTDDARVLTHRVAEVTHARGATLVQTRGDANPGPDPWRAELMSDRVWVVAAVVPHVGRVLQAFQDPPAWIVLSVLVPAALAVSALRSIWRRPAAGPAGGPGPAGPPSPPRRPVRRPVRRGPAHWTGRRCWDLRSTPSLLPVAGAAAALLVVVGAGPAAAYFSAAVGRGHSVRAAVLVTPTGVTADDSCLFVGRVVVDVSWTPGADDRGGFRVERRTGTNGTWVVLGTAARTATTYRDSTPNLLTQYSYRVTSTRSTWTSAPSAVATLTTLGTC